MGWRDFQVANLQEFMETMESINTGTALIPLIPLIPLECIPEKGGAPPLPTTSANWRPEFKIWLTQGGELRTTGICEDLAAEIENITAFDLPLQRDLLERHCEAFDRHHISSRWEEWAFMEERPTKGK
jgi:hypothetical protein